MKRTILAAALAGTLSLLAIQSPARAADHGPVGLGLMLGDPNGLNVKFQFTDLISLDLGVGYAFMSGGHLHTHLDLLFEFDLKKWQPGELSLYFGVGPKLGWFAHLKKNHPDGHIRFGIRFPIGLTFFFSEVPIDIFLEGGPGLWAFPKPGFSINAAIGARYWF